VDKRPLLFPNKTYSHAWRDGMFWFQQRHQANKTSSRTPFLAKEYGLYFCTKTCAQPAESWVKKSNFVHSIASNVDSWGKTVNNRCVTVWINLTVANL
jgi:hypothetical protein